MVLPSDSVNPIYGKPLWLLAIDIPDSGTDCDAERDANRDIIEDCGA